MYASLLHLSKLLHFTAYEISNTTNATNGTSTITIETNDTIELPNGFFRILQNSGDKVGVFFNRYSTSVLFPLLLPTGVAPENYSYVINSSVIAASLAGREVPVVNNLEDQVIVRLTVGRIQAREVYTLHT